MDLSGLGGVYIDVDANEIQVRAMNDGGQAISTGEDRRSTAPDWGATVRLAFVVSIVAGIVAATFAGRIGEQALIIGILAVASLVGWHHAEHPPTAVPLRVRRR